MSYQSRERGQILIIFVFALTVLLGFVALTIDGGMIFADRRFSQAVADSSSLAGAGVAGQTLEAGGITYTGFDCYNSNVRAAVTAAYNAARTRASQNQVTTLDNNLADKHGVEIICVNLPNQRDRYLDVHTQVTSNVSTSFMHLFYGGRAVNTVDAVVRVRPRAELTYGNAIISLNPQDLSGMQFINGSVVVSTEGGGIFSNSAIEGGGSFKVKTIGGYPINYTLPLPDGLDIKGKAGSFSPYPTKGSSPIDVAQFKASLPPPVCGANRSAINGSANITPGTYPSIRLNNGTLRMAPGLYCLNGDFTVTGGNVVGDGVTIYFISGGLYSSGGADWELRAPSGTPTGGALRDVLIYLADGNTSEVSMLGSSDQTWSGTVYAPSGTIEIGGDSRLDTPGGGSTQLVADKLRFHGNPEVTIKYSTSSVFTLSPMIDMIR